MKPPVLVINSYGGSLTLATQQEGHEIIGSMEDHNFGLDSQRLNFPGLRYFSTLADWPLDVDLRDKIVIAHPPCSAFSSQNRGKNTRGPNAAAFSCTTRLLEYVMPRGAEVIAIESVPGALEGARSVHDFYANAWGYDLYRVLQNAASFGVPQWRRRFWAIFVKRKPGRKQSFTFVLQHKVRYLKDVFPLEAPEVDLDPSIASRWTKQLVLAEQLGYKTEAEFRKLLANPPLYGNLIQIIADKHELPKKKGWPPWGDLHKLIIGGNFLSGALHVLNPNGLAPVLLGPCWWYYGNRQLGYADYKEIMGFPRDYMYHKPRLTFVLLSKGVCPPVARWILREIDANVFNIDRSMTDLCDPLPEVCTINPNETANLYAPQHLKGSRDESVT